MEDDIFRLPPLVPLENYMESEGKLSASIKWLIARVYHNDVPDKLRNGLDRHDMHNTLNIDAAVLTALTNGSLYSQAAAKIFHEPHLVNQSHAAVLAALTDYGIDVVQRQEEGGQPVTQAELQSDPFKITAHLAMMDALMLAHLRNIITVDRVVEAVSRHTSVDDRERPMDSADALLFWINKICLLVRDDVERSNIRLKGAETGGTIPEMEDLYDELSDGQCLCAMVAWYRPKEMEIEDIYFDDPMTNPCCQFNLMLLQNFCATELPWNPFYMEIEDLLYLHDSLQMNINVFLADLFDMFEPPPITPVQEVVQSPRRFVPIHAIPELRAANQAARSVHPPRVRNPFHSVQVTQSPSRSMSMMSQDSLLTNRTADSWRVNPQRNPPEHWGNNVTNFSRLQQGDGGSSGNVSQAGYIRSDSMPAPSVRLALEEKRREHEKMRAIKSTMSESERAEKSKATFFELMKRRENQATDMESADSPSSKLIRSMTQKMSALEDKLNQMHLQNEQQHKMNRALSQPSVYQEMPPMAPQSARPSGTYGTLPHGISSQSQYPSYGQPNDYYAYQQQQGHYAQPQMRSSLSNGMLNYLPGQIPPQHPQYPDYNSMMHQQMAMQQQPYVQQDAYSQWQQGNMQQQQPGFTLMQQSAHASTGFSLHHPPATAMSLLPSGTSPATAYHYGQQASPMDITPPPSYAQQQHHQGGGYTYNPDMQSPGGYDDDNDHSTQAFKLHNHDASSSRLDPPLEINRNLTNWGITYKQGHSGRPQRRTWENQTFIKSEHDLVNQPDLVPHVTTEDDQMQQRRSPSVVGSIARRSRDSRDDASSPLPKGDRMQQVCDPDPPASNHMSPPRDPGSHSNGNGDVSGSVPAAGFVVSDDQAADDFDKIAEQRRQAKRAALLAKTIKRKEDIPNKIDQMEQRNAEKKMAEMAKKEMNEQRKLEKELQRQKILENYKRKKVEDELAADGTSSARGPSRGHSQPPFIRTKSQMSESALSIKSDVRAAPRSRGQSTVEARVIPVASLQEPTHKLFIKASPKSNRGLILNALTYSVFPGAVNDTTRMKTLQDLAKSDAKHFLLLFRDHKCQYRGLYSWDQTSDTAIRISGQGPTKCTEAIMKLMFKYDSGAKNFSQIPTKHLSATIDGFSIQDQFWQKAKIPHSGATASHRNN